jgi:hypothetical protein
VTSNPGGVTATGAASPITVTGLTNGIAYTFKVTARNTAGSGDSSAATAAVTPAAAPGAPGAVVATPGNAQVIVAFTAPAANGAVITGYTVTSEPGGVTATGAASPLIVTGLTNGIAYTFTVRATNIAGTGSASEPSAPVTPNAPPEIAYATPAPYTLGVLITPLSVASTGGPVASFTITPALPTGLSFNGATGAITGTPTAIKDATPYTIVATGPGGIDTAVVTLSVRIPPPMIFFEVANVVDSVGVPAVHTPFIMGIVTSCTSNPPLPAGLVLNPTTCVISGTPGTATPMQQYSITATNSTGSSTSMLNLTVIPRTVAIDPGAFVFQVSGADKPYTFRLPTGFAVQTEKVTLDIVDAWGRKMWSKSIRPAETTIGEVSWDGRSSNGRLASAGMYVVRISVVNGNGTTTHIVRKSVTLKPR